MATYVADGGKLPMFDVECGADEPRRLSSLGLRPRDGVWKAKGSVDLGERPAVCMDADGHACGAGAAGPMLWKPNARPASAV